MKQFVLVGAGHVHMALVSAAETFAHENVALTLVDPAGFWYGGARVPLLAGQRDAPSLRVALSAFCRTHQVRWLQDRAVGLDARHRRVWLASGGMIEYDAVALNVGQQIDRGGLESASSGVQVWNAAHVYEMAQLVAALTDAKRRGRRPRVAIAGCGRRAVEVMVGLAAGAVADVDVYTPGAQLWPNAPAGLNRFLAKRFALQGIDIVAQTRPAALDARAMISTDGRAFAADHVVLAADYRPAQYVFAGDLAADEGGLYVTERLQSPTAPSVFASGGCAQLLGAHTLAMDDIEAQARVVGHNVRALFRRRPFVSYRPRPRLQHLDLGDGSGVSWIGHRLWWRSRAAARACARREAHFMGRMISQ